MQDDHLTAGVWFAFDMARYFNNNITLCIDVSSQTIGDFLFPDPPRFVIFITDVILSVTHSLTLKEAKKTII